MKKSFVALLIGLALVVMISPGIVGRFAEQSMDENLDWAANESQGVVITSQGFDRGWFSSEGQHRIELKDGQLHDLLQAYAGTNRLGQVPALIIDTHLDHGLIPVASMSRDRGSLLPGLGSAISTLSVEAAGGEVFGLPGTIYSTVGLTGELQSNFVLEAGSFKQDGATAFWGKTEILVTTNPSSGAVGFDGSIESLAIDSFQEAGEIIGPLTFTSTSSVDGDRLDAHVTLLLKNVPFADMGAAGIAAEFRIEGADGRAIGGIMRAMENMQDGAYSGALQASMETDARRLLASGVSLHLDQLDISSPQGLLTMAFDFQHPETDLDRFSWTSALLVMDVSANISIPAELMDLITTMNPQAHAAIAMGFLRRKGDAYEMEASFENGLLTVNGAPMPLPVPGLR